MNRLGQPLARFGVYNMIWRYVKKILPDNPSLKNKRISPHTIRHTTATHLLNAGVDINTIRAWLEHVSINTTNIYVEVDMEIKAKALASCEFDNTTYNLLEMFFEIFYEQRPRGPVWIH